MSYAVGGTFCGYSQLTEARSFSLGTTTLEQDARRSSRRRSVGRCKQAALARARACASEWFAAAHPDESLALEQAQISHPPLFGLQPHSWGAINERSGRSVGLHPGLRCKGSLYRKRRKASKDASLYGNPQSHLRWCAERTAPTACQIASELQRLIDYRRQRIAKFICGTSAMWGVWAGR